MNELSAESFVGALAVIGAVVIVSALLVRRRGALALRVLGPGTLLNAALIALAGWWLLGLGGAEATILGAALASSDPVLLRWLLRRRDIPADARHALQLESGLNDIVLLPVVLVAMTYLHPAGLQGGAGLAKLALDLFILGPGAGILVGLLGVAALDLVRRRLGVRRDYESLYSLGIAFTAFSAAEAVHGSGFLAAFAAGITIAALDVELCDCFVESGGMEGGTGPDRRLGGVAGGRPTDRVRGGSGGGRRWLVGAGATLRKFILA